jgi:hypothetical protein
MLKDGPFTLIQEQFDYIFGLVNLEKKIPEYSQSIVGWQTTDLNI